MLKIAKGYSEPVNRKWNITQYIICNIFLIYFYRVHKKEQKCNQIAIKST